MSEAHRLKEAAERLKNDDVLQLAFDNAKQKALLDLSVADATNADEIRRLQAVILAVDSIRNSLVEMILKAPQERISGLAPTIVKRIA